MHHDSRRRRRLGGLLVLAALAAGGCGAGSTVVATDAPSITSLTPSTFVGASGGPFTIIGTGLPQIVGTTVQVTFRATGGATPFAGGTSATLRVPGTITSPNTLTGLMPPICIPGGTTVTMNVFVQLPSGAQSSASGTTVTVTGPAITGFLPLVPIICPNTPFTVSGTGFGPVGGTTTVTFTAPAPGTPFAGGTSNTLVVPNATIVSTTQISGVAPDPGVAGPVVATITLAHACGPPLTGGTGVVARFAVPTVTAFAPTTPIVGAGTAVTVTGAGFEPVGGTATVTFTAPGATTPFAGGTSNTLVIPNANIDSASQISGTCPDPMTGVAVAATVTVTIPCGKSGTGGVGVVANFGASGVDGKLQYQFVPHVAYNPTGTATQTSGLNFGATQTRDLAGVRVQLVRTSDQAVLASAASAADGTYSLDAATTATVVVRVLARSHTGPVIQVVDNNNADALWSMQSAPFTFTARVTQNLTATTGWGGAAYTGPRLAAPFAVFSTLWAATQKILANVTPQPVFPPCLVKWSPGNNQAAAFWSPSGMFIMLRGADGVNTDEFDTHVLVHEWGHYFESSFSRSDSPGGQHFINLSYHPSLAWGEGWATGLAGMMLEPDSVYSDTSGPLNAGGFMVDIERRLSPFPTTTFGWYNEWTIWELVYDLSDTNNEGAWDTLSLGIQGLYNSLAGGQANTDAFVSVFSFIDTLKTDNPGSAAAIDAMCASHGMTSPVQDQWGTGEANNGGAATNLPVYKSLTLNAAATTLALTRTQFNTLGATQLCRFTGNGAQVTVVGTAPAGNAQNLPQFFPFANGVWTGVGLGPVPGGSSSGSFFSVNGQEYAVWVRHGGTSIGGTYSPTIRVTSP